MPLPHLPELWLNNSPKPHLRPVFPGGHRQRPVAGSQGAAPAQSQSCWHPSPYVPASQPGLRGEIEPRYETVPRDPAAAWGGRRSTGYLSDSARRRARPGTGSARWLGHSRLRARSRSGPGSQLRGSPGGNLGWRWVGWALKHGWVELGLSCSLRSKASASPPERSSEPFSPRSARLLGLPASCSQSWGQSTAAQPRSVGSAPQAKLHGVVCLPGRLGMRPLHPAVACREQTSPSLQLPPPGRAGSEHQ